MSLTKALRTQSPGVDRVEIVVNSGGRECELRCRQAIARDAATVPELQRDASTRIVHRAHQRRPGFDLLARVDARSAIPGARLRHDVGRFGDDQAGRGTLDIVLDHHCGRYPFERRARARERRHDDAIGGARSPIASGVNRSGISPARDRRSSASAAPLACRARLCRWGWREFRQRRNSVGGA